MDAKPDIFVVRIWHQPQEFRASVRSVRSERTRYFIRPEDLLRYLLNPQAEQGAEGRGLEPGGAP